MTSATAVFFFFFATPQIKSCYSSGPSEVTDLVGPLDVADSGAPASLFPLGAVGDEARPAAAASRISTSVGPGAFWYQSVLITQSSKPDFGTHCSEASGCSLDRALHFSESRMQSRSAAKEAGGQGGFYL